MPYVPPDPTDAAWPFGRGGIKATSPKPAPPPCDEPVAEGGLTRTHPRSRKARPSQRGGIRPDYLCHLEVDIRKRPIRHRISAGISWPFPAPQDPAGNPARRLSAARGSMGSQYCY